ncbi:MAG: DNA cytosine methyltransferase [Nanoarchaeota archaeon]|nr:DNA cytosine methyltransferase [Nanoarchaeota archaeon]
MKIISLFCGAGGMDYGFIKAGHKIVWANDNDQDSCNTYEGYFKHKPVCKPIGDILSSEIPEADVVIGGFPCQGFSIANPYRNTKDSRNKLYLELKRIIRDKKPKYFIAENVTGLCSLGGYKDKKDKKEHKGIVLKKILKELEKANEMGYHIEFKILNSADFGVPQIRRRAIILGTRKDISTKLKHPNPILSKEEWKTVGEALGGLPEQPDKKGDKEQKEFNNHIGTGHRVKINNYMGNRPTNLNKPSPTIVGRGGGTGGPVIIPHPNGKRRMTVRETARLQSFPDDFIFEGSVTSQYRQIGNAVPWLLAFYIAKMLPED